MVKKPTISVIVLNYNGLEHLEGYFYSLFKQTLMPDEVIMFDNLSTDGSREFVAEKYPKVKIVKEDKYNTGTATGSNIAFEHTKGDYVVFHSNDLVLDKNCIMELVKEITFDRKNAISTSTYVWFKKDNRNQLIIGNAGGLLDKYGFGMQNYPDETLNSIPDRGEVFFAYGSSFIISRKLFKQLSGFDDRLFTLNEDIDLSWRARLLGYKVTYTKKSFVYHKGSATLKFRPRAQKRYWAERNSIRVFIKNANSMHMIKILPKYVILLIAQMSYFLYRLKFSLFVSDIRAILWNLLYLPETLMLRKKIQKTVKPNNSEEIMYKSSFKLKLFSSLKNSL